MSLPASPSLSEPSIVGFVNPYQARVAAPEFGSRRLLDALCAILFLP